MRVDKHNIFDFMIWPINNSYDVSTLYVFI